MAVDVDNYFKGFKPSFNEERFNELMSNPVTSIQTPQGKVYLRSRLFKSFLMSCKYLWNELDRNNLYYGTEGGGKSHTAFQHTYVWWWLLKELGMINYEFGLHLIYRGLKDLMNAWDKYEKIPFMIYTLDESSDLDRARWNHKDVKLCVKKMREERKNLRVVNFILPVVDEFHARMFLTRINWVFYVKMKVDEDFNLIRGDFTLMNIPVGDSYYSALACRDITRTEILNYWYERLFFRKGSFSPLPKRLSALTDKTNKTFMFDKEEYKEWSRANKNGSGEEEPEELTTRQKIQKKQRDKLILYLVNHKGESRQEVAKMLNLGTSSVDRVIRAASPPKIKV